MSRQPTRRYFLQAAASAGAVLGLGEWSVLSPLSPTTAAEVRIRHRRNVLRIREAQAWNE